ncbi:MAG: hypothetical protein H0V29_09760 [Thermoleophilaceae bacterium]|nr:hypothetical protein [Thermoleophilaceae bacterium]
MRRLTAFLMPFTAGVPVAHAADPILPLAEVQPGMSCTGLSVIKGTAVSSFDVEIVDVLPGGNATVSGPRILIRVSGPAVDATGIGPGFSGSPIYCNGRNAGAISESVGEYGNKAALATPIEQIIGTPVDPPPATRADRTHAASIARTARPLAALTVGGLSPSLGRRVSTAARKAGRTVIQVPTSGGGAGIPPQTLVPGSAAAASYTSGDIVLGSVGTVAYTDGPNVWLFGHSVDAAGPRAPFLQDARVFSVINQPLALPDATTFKLALPGNNLGRVGNDATATVGKLGQQPPPFPMQVDTKDDDTGTGRSVRVQVADEASVGNPIGDISPFTIAGSLAVGQAAQAALGGNLPPRLSGSMCVRMKWREVKGPISTCFRYSGSSVSAEEGGTGVVDLMTADFQTIASLIGSFTFRPIHVEDVKVAIHLRRGLRQSFMTSGRATPARPGGTSRVTLNLANAGGGRDTLETTVPVPSRTKPGRRIISVVGTGLDDPAAASEIVLELFGDEENPEAEEKALAGEPGPRTAAELADEVEGLERFSGLRFRVGGRRAKALQVAGRRISGRVEIPLRVRR